MSQNPTLEPDVLLGLRPRATAVHPQPAPSAVASSQASDQAPTLAPTQVPTQVDLPLATPGIQRWVWHSRFGSMLIETAGEDVFVNGQRVQRHVG